MCSKFAEMIYMYFSSFGAMILKIWGHHMNCVGVCQHFKDYNRRIVESILHGKDKSLFVRRQCRAHM